MTLLFLVALILKLIYDGVVAFRADVIVSINNPYKKYRELVAQNQMEVHR